MTTGEAAAYIGVPVSTLYLWRQKRTGPAASKIGKHLRYHVDLVDEWMQRQVEVAS